MVSHTLPTNNNQRNVTVATIMLASLVKEKLHNLCNTEALDLVSAITTHSTLLAVHAKQVIIITGQYWPT